jgi:hypothetical protein
MALPNRIQHDNSNLEAFLFADIGPPQPNGAPLTVLSLLALNGLDPWAEAERLSHMSRSAAVSAIISELNRAPACYRSNVDVNELCDRAVARLPLHEPVKPVDVSIAGTGFEGIPVVAAMMMFYAILTLGLLALLLEKG